MLQPSIVCGDTDEGGIYQEDNAFKNHGLAYACAGQTQIHPIYYQHNGKLRLA